MVDTPTSLHLASAIRDAAGVSARPGAVAVRGNRIVASGAPGDVRRALDRRPDTTIDHGDVLLLPAFVNAHAHLDLTAIGPRPFSGSFVDWVGVVIRDRPLGADAVTAAVHAGLRGTRDAGVGWIGDIASSDHAVDARATAPVELRVPGVAWLEVFGIGRRAARGADAAESRVAALQQRHRNVPDLRIDLQPHAPYSAGRAVFERAARLGAPATHLAETREETEFVRRVSGPFRELLSRVQEWDDTIVPLGASPVRALEPVLRAAPWVVAHCNYADDDDLDTLARCRELAVAYCPVASEYFGHSGHRYREMLARGINVCLGTDSVLCQPPDEPQPFGLLPACRRLFARDGADPDLLLEMATVRGARALRLEPRAATLAVGAPARLCTVEIDPRDPTDPWRFALTSTSATVATIESRTPS